MDRRWHLGWLLAGSALLAWGAYCYVASRPTAHRQTLDVAQLEQGEPLPGRWVRIAGTLRPLDRLIQPAGAYEEVYVPLVSPAWQAGSPVAVLVRTTNKEREPRELLQFKGEAVEGIIDPRGLRDDVRRRYDLEERRAAADVHVLDYLHKPVDDSLAYAYVCLPVGMLIVLITGAAWCFHPSPPSRERGAGGEEAVPLHQPEPPHPLSP